MPRARGLVLPGSRRLLAGFSDERLVAAVRAGNERAFEVLYDRHHRGVLGFCRHMLGSADEAEDAVQQAFVSAHRDMLRDAKEIRFKAWIYTIARNRCLSILRARREHSSEEIDIAVDRLSEDVAQRADLKDLLRDIAELPDRQRAALVLSEVADLSHAEVAQVVECEVSQVKSLVFQARSSLIDRRRAREMPCEEIREELATLKGGSLRRSHLRHHLKECPGCSAFREDVRRQRQMMAVALPVLPSLGLKDSVLAAVGFGGGAGGAGAAAGGATLAAKSGGFGLAAHGLAAKVAAVVVVAGGTAGGGAIVMEARDGGAGTPPAAAVAPALAAEGGDGGGSGTGAASEDAGERGEERSAKRKGFTPVKGESNGERAREFAATRGRGKHTGLSKRQQRAKRARKLRAERARKRQVVRRRGQERAATGAPAPPESQQRPQQTRPAAPSPAKPAPQPEPVEPAPEPEPLEPAPEIPQTTSGAKPPKLK